MAGYSVTFSVVDDATKKIDEINRRIQQMRAPMERLRAQSQKLIETSGLKKISDGFTEIGKSALSAFESMARIVPVLGAITSAASLAGVVRMVGAFAEFGRTLQRDADQIGTTTQTLQALQDAIRLAGGSADEMIGSLKDLRTAAGNAITGRDTVALQRFARAGIDVNKAFYDTTSVLPDVIKYIDSFDDAHSRMTVAMQLGGRELYELDETLRRSGKTLQQWEDEQRKAGALLSGSQLAALQRYRQAIGGLEVTFDRLGQQVSATLAEHFAPLLETLNSFVQQHAPQIIAAVDRISAAFADWLQHVDWSKVEQGAETLGQDLAWVGTHLDTIAKTAEWIAVLFATKWAIGMVASIVQVTAAIGTMNASLLLSLTRFGLIAAAAGGAWAAWKTMSNPSGADAAASKAGEWGINKWLDPAYLIGRAGKAIFGGGAAAPPPATAPAPAAPPPTTGAGGPQGANDNDLGYGTGQLGALQRAILQTESSGGTNYNALPVKGHSAAGPMQIEPGTFAENAQPGEQLGNFNDNIRVGNRLIAKLYQKYHGDVDKVAYAYANGSLVSPDRNPGYTGTVRANMAAHPEWAMTTPTAPTPDSMPRAEHTPGGGGGTSDTVDQMVAMAGTRGAAVREFLRDPSGKIARDPDLGLWCAEFTNSYLRHIGVKGTGSLMAASFADWGHQVAANDVTKGDVLLNFNRKHVGVATGRTRMNPRTGAFEVEEVSSNSLGPGGEVMNLPGRRWRSDVEVRRSSQLAALQSQGPAATVAATGGPSPSGTVDVTITHKNPPPGASVTASHDGEGVNVAPVRVEHQNFGAVG
jgi:hypothetical protein